MIRLFVGLKIPYDICDELLLLCSGLENARWVKKENFHITLQFIGPVQESYIDDLIQCLSEVSFSQFSLTRRNLFLLTFEKDILFDKSNLREDL